MMFVAVMSAFARAGDYAKTRELFVMMTEMGVPPEHMHANALLASCSRAGDIETAQAIFDMMPKWGLAPRVEDYAVMIGIARHNLALCKGFFAEMAQAGITPSGLAYESLLEAHVVAGDRAGARALLDEIAERNVEADTLKFGKLKAQMRDLP